MAPELFVFQLKEPAQSACRAYMPLMVYSMQKDLSDEPGHTASIASSRHIYLPRETDDDKECFQLQSSRTYARGRPYACKSIPSLLGHV